jgi:hypothetical protein
MLRFFGLVLAVVLFAAPALAACPPAPRPDVTVSVTEAPVKYITRYSQQDLQRIGQRWNAAVWQENYEGGFKGLLQDNIAVDHKISFGETQDPQNGASCLYIRRADLKLRLDAVIYIAANYQYNATWFKKIFVHEGEHMAADRTLLEEYKDRFADAFRFAYKKPDDYEVKLVRVSTLPREKRQMEDTLNLAVNAVFKQMVADRDLRQRHVDGLP